MKNFKSNESCVCCGHDVENEQTYHHEYSQGSHPEYKFSKWNLISLCKSHHDLIHNPGSMKLSEKFPSLKKWFIENDWYVCPIMKRWVHEKM